MLIHFTTNAKGELLENTGHLEESVWIDLFDPTPLERKIIQDSCQVDLPMHHELYQIEYSNRFYEEQGNLFLSFSIVTKAAPMPESHVMTMVLSEKRIITLRYSDPNPVNSFIEQINKQPTKVAGAGDIFVRILSKMAGRVADLFELIGSETEGLSILLISTSDNTFGSKSSGTLSKTLLGINKLENLLSKNLQSLGSLTLMLGFVHHYEHQYIPEAARIDLDTTKQDIANLHKNGEYLNQKLGFQLQSNLGLINTQQNQIIKVFTVLAMVFMPPTLIASIYGMNFRNMPELSTAYGYYVAMAAMLLAAVIPYQYFKRKGWI